MTNPLLAAVLAHPADDTVRLAYADFLEEHGDSALAEFIRVQIALSQRSRLPVGSNTELHRRERELLEANWREWLDGTGLEVREFAVPLGTPFVPGRWATFTRGLLT